MPPCQASGIVTAYYTQDTWEDGMLKYSVVCGSFLVYAVMVTLQSLSIRRFQLTKTQFNAKIGMKDSDNIDIMAGIISFDKLAFRREDLIGSVDDMHPRGGC